MKKLILLIFISSAFVLKSQNYYSFSKSMGTYTNLSGTSTVINGSWDDFEKAVKLPFPFKLFTTPFTDSIYIDDYGSISIDNTYSEDLSYFGEDYESRGNNLSEVSYVVEGTTPNRIFKLQFKNVGLFADAPLFKDSLNFQLWLYETSNIIETRIGPGNVTPANWDLTGPFVGILNPANPTSYIIIEGNANNPTVNTNNIMNVKSLDGLPASGTIYRFTPSQFQNGINNSSVKINVIKNNIILPSNIEVNQIEVLDMCGKTILKASNANDLNLSNLPHGMYVINVQTSEGILTQKFIQ